MMNRLERRYGRGRLYLVTCSCYRREPLLGAERVFAFCSPHAMMLSDK